MERARFIVRGHVQGVGFRWFVRERARALGVTGWVRNCPDGSVEVLAAGEATGISELRTHLQRGPRGARIEAVDDLPATDESDAVDSFEIVR